MKGRTRFLILALVVTNLTTTFALEYSTKVGERTVKALIYRFGNYASDSKSKLVSSKLLSIDSSLSKGATQNLAAFLEPFASLGLLKDAPQNLALSDSSLSFVDNCPKVVPENRILYFSGNAQLNKSESGLLVFGNQTTSSLELIFFDESELCRIFMKLSVRLGGGYISISRLLVDRFLPPASSPVHTTPLDLENFLYVGRDSTVYLTSPTNSFDPKYLGRIWPLSENNLFRSGGVKSIVFLDDTLYTAVAYTDSKNNCAKLKILSSRLDFTKRRLHSTKTFFEMPRCFRNTKDLNLLAAGGKIHVRDESRMLFTIGNAEIWNGSETVEYLNDVGTLIEIDIATGQYEQISRGHRNPQGIATCMGKVLLSEQGPDGGDEINDVTAGGDFGWPRNSYGSAYSVESARDESTFGSHLYGKRPLIAWVPSIAAGDLFCEVNPEVPGITLWMATLKDKALHRIFLDERNLVVFDERIPVNERVRDFYKIGQKFYYSTDDGRLFLFVHRALN